MEVSIFNIGLCHGEFAKYFLTTLMCDRQRQTSSEIFHHKTTHQFLSKFIYSTIAVYTAVSHTYHVQEIIHQSHGCWRIRPMDTICIASDFYLRHTADIFIRQECIDPQSVLGASYTHSSITTSKIMAYYSFEFVYTLLMLILALCMSA